LMATGGNITNSTNKSCVKVRVGSSGDEGVVVAGVQTEQKCDEDEEDVTTNGGLINMR